ncbi:MAG: phosphatase PAP2 family protein [Actinomycetota bacterium]|nr:phosphatase PAP2 family protein [Actinomycetota bacterium]
MTRRPIVPAALVTRLPLITALTTVWVAAWALTTAGRDHPAPWVATFDDHVRHLFRPLRGVAEQFAELGNPGRLVLIAAALIAVCLIGRSRIALAAAGASVTIQLIVVEGILKPVIDSRLAPGDAASYPSGHSATAVCLGTLVVLLIGRSAGPLRLALPRVVRWVFTVLGVAVGPVVGISMISVGAHTFIDVVGALPLGATLTLLVCAGIDRIGSADQALAAAGSGPDNRSTAATAVTAVTAEPSMSQTPTTPS